MKKYSLLFYLFNFLVLNVTGESDLYNPIATYDDISQVQCDPTWKQSQTGVSVQMLADDIDADGQIELVCHAGVSSFDYGNYWYILEYSPESDSYYQRDISRFYNYVDGTIQVLELFDINQDGRKEIVIAFEGKRIEIYDGITLDIIDTVELPYDWVEIVDLLMADADNDGQQELVCGSQEETYILNAATLQLKQELGFGAVEIVCGNVDSDPLNELVFSFGEIYELTSSGLVPEWKYNDFMYGRVKLLDIDNDGMEEIITSSDSLYVYDADLKQLKWKAETEYGLEASQVTDIEEDGNFEILYSNGFGDMFCLRASTGDTLWQRDHIQATKILVANSDNTEGNELIITIGSDHTGPDYIIVYDPETFEKEWQSIAVESPYSDVEVADVDDDGQNEVITLTSANPSYVGNGIVSIFDLSTHKLEWQCDEELFPYVTNGMLDILVCDYDNDGVTEIILPTGYNFGELYFLNGVTHEIELEHSFYPDISSILDIEFRDMDGDSDKEFVVLDHGNVYFVNPLTFAIEWTSPDLAWNPNWGNIYLKIGNVDNDPEEEIVVISSAMHIINPASDTIWNTDTWGYTSFCLFDYDEDGIEEIVAGHQEKIEMIDGITHEITEIEHINNNSFETVDGIAFTTSEIPVMMYTFDGILYFRSRNGDLMATERLSDWGYGEILPVDYDSDGREEIFVTSGTQVAEFSYDCYKCLGYKLNSQALNPHCPEGGEIILDPEGGIPPYSFAWSNGSILPVLSNIPGGTYEVDVTDNQGCLIHKEFTLQEYGFSAYDIVKEPDNSLTAECEGRAHMEFFGGTPPYTFYLDDQEIAVSYGGITDLCAGTYYFRIEDSKGCNTFLDLTIDAILGDEEFDQSGLKVYPVPANDILYVELPISPIFGEATIGAEIVTVQGIIVSDTRLTAPRTEIDLSHLQQGIYFLRIRYANGIVIRKLIVTRH